MLALRRALVALLSLFVLSLSLVAHAHEAHDQEVRPPPGPPPPPPPCEENCWLLSSLTLRGDVRGSLSFELRGTVRSPHEERIPLFGPASEVRLDDVTLDGARAPIGFEGGDYHVFVGPRRPFTLRGRITLGNDQILSVPGPVVAVDAHLTHGRLVEGERLSGVSGTVLHFDPMVDDAEAVTKPKPAMVFRLSRALRFGDETAFVYRIVASHGTELGTLRVPLRFGEKVKEVQGSQGWEAKGDELTLPTTGTEAEILVTGTLPASAGPRSFTPDDRSAYEWWMIESDPEHRVAVGGEGKLVETSQSPIPATMPGARVYLVQRGQRLEVDARSLVRGDVLAAVARTNRRFVAITGRGELISDETVSFDNNGLDHLMITPAGKAMYLSTDGAAQRILHTEAGSAEVLVPVRPGPHQLRVQSLSDVRLWPLAGALAIPPTTYPIATSSMEVVVGVPEHVRPLAVLGGDRVRWAYSFGDLLAVALGVVVACFGFRTRRTRALGAIAVAGLWFVSREGYVFAAGALFAAGAIFLATRFLRGTWLLVASGAALVVALVGGRVALSSDATSAPTRGLFYPEPSLPMPESSSASSSETGGATPVSLSFPTSERYVWSSRQLVTRERPFVPRIVYVTNTLVAALHVAWLGLVAALVWAHREHLARVKARLLERLSRRPDPTVVPEGAPRSERGTSRRGLGDVRSSAPCGTSPTSSASCSR